MDMHQAEDEHTADEDTAREDTAASGNRIRPIVEAAWREVLGDELEFADTDDFFNRGGHSILALRVAGTLSAALGRDVPIRLLFTQTRLAGLVEALSSESSVADRHA